VIVIWGGYSWIMAGFVGDKVDVLIMDAEWV
jgi:hypothetical protein